MLAALLASGGDSRIAIDPRTSRNRYGAAVRPQPRDIVFASCTASSPSARGFAAAAGALERSLAAPDICLSETIRQRLLACYGVPQAQCILAPSGTDCATLATALVGGGRRQAVLSLIAPNSETGSSVAAAAAGRRHDPTPPFGARGAVGERLAGFGTCDSLSVPVRTAGGDPLSPDSYEQRLAASITDATRDGSHVILHLLDSSKTGIAPLARAAARRLQAIAPGQVTILVDACQLRCPSELIRNDLAQGWLVMITGSKFAAGPAFSGALLVPPGMAGADCADLDGLAELSACDDWPADWTLRPRALTATRNLGLLLRWEAALAEIEPYERADADARQACLDLFADAVRSHVAARPELSLIAGGQPDRVDTIFTIATRGDWGDAAGAVELRNALASGAVRCDVGQPVAIGDDGGAALRVCASMPLINDALAACAAGRSVAEAMAPIMAQLDILFGTWGRIALPAPLAKAS